MADLHELRPKEIFTPVALQATNKNKIPSTFESLASGALGGVSLVIVGHPLDLLKVRLQTANADGFPIHPNDLKMGKMFSNLLKSEGLSGIYRGVTAPLLGVAPIFALSIWGFDTGKSLACKYLNLDPAGISVVTLGGAFSALPTSLLQVPGDRIKLRLQISDSRKHGNPIREAQNIWMDGRRNIQNSWIGGFKSLYRGYWVTLAREIPGSATYFTTYYHMRSRMSSANDSEAAKAVTILISGGIAGTINGILTLPIDTIKSRMQAVSVLEFKSFNQTLQGLLRIEGPGALFKGLSPVLLRAFPANAACFGGIEIVRYLFSL